MKNSLVVLMLVAIATLVFAFTTPKANFADVSYKYENGGWQEGVGQNCNGNDELCQVSFDEKNAPYAKLVLARISKQKAGTFNISVDHDSNPATDSVVVQVHLQRKAK